ncbi:hypothetical protein ACS0TY_003582 [Phlomoides rotata]
MEIEEASEALNAIQAETALLGDSNDRLLTEIDCTIRLNDVLTQHQFYTELFMAHDQDTYDDTILVEFIHSVVDVVDNDMLTTMPSVEEIKRAVFDRAPSSFPGHDGFGGSFYHPSWDIIAFDVIEAVRYFLTTRFIPFNLNSSFVTLIPKKPGANRVEDFRPIVMGNYLFKIFTKIIASRLGAIAARILTPFQ